MGLVTRWTLVPAAVGRGLDDLGAAGRQRVPDPAEGVQSLAVGLALLGVLDERVDRVMVVGHLNPPVGALGRAQPGRLGPGTGTRLGGRDQGRPGAGARS